MKVLRREFAFVDPAVQDLDVLLEGLRPQIAVYILSAAEPAPRQMARVLARHHGIDVLHVIAHGQPGEVSFAGGVLSLENLDDHREDLSRIGSALSADGEIRLWVCDAAGGDKGAAFMGAFARHAGVPTAASTGRVGAAAHGGSWTLDVGPAGPVLPPLTSRGIAGYAGVLATFKATTGIDDLFGGNSPDTFIVTDTNQIQAADRFDGGGNSNTVEVGTASGVDVDLTAAAADGVNGFLNITEIAFANTSGTSTVTVDADQFGLGRAAKNSTVTGADGIQNFVINLTTPSSFDLSALTFNRWNAGTDTVTVNGSSGADTITVGDNVSARVLAGAGDDTLVYTGATVAPTASNDGGTGTDTLEVPQNTDFSGAASDGVDGFINIEGIEFVDTTGTIVATFAAAQFGLGKISLTSTITGDTRTQVLVINLSPGESLDLSGFSFSNWTSGADTIIINGSTGGETIVGTSQSDIIVSGGGGFDILTGGGGLDTFRFSAADAALVFGNGNGNNGSVTGYITITDFAPGATAAASELLSYPALGIGSSSTTNDSTLLLHTGATIKSHTISNGMVTFNDGTGSQSLITFGDVAAATQYLAANDWGKDGATVAFIATISGVTHTYVYTQTTKNAGIANGAMVDLVDVLATGLVDNGTTLSVLEETAPNAPTISSIPENSGGGINAVEASDGTAVLVSLAGTGAISNDTLTINWGSQTVTHSLSAGDILAGSATVTVPQAKISAQGDGTFDVTANLTNAAGIVGANSPPVSVTVDTSAPSAPTIASIPENSGGGINAVEASDGTAVVVGLAGSGAVAGDTLTIGWGGQTVSHTLLAGEIAGNSATVTVPTATIEAQGQGTFDVTAGLTDAAGNAGPSSAATPVTVDTSAPTAVVAITAIAPDNGTSSSDFVTNATTLTVSGTHGVLGAGEKVQVSSDGGASWADATSTTSTWSYSDPATHGTSFTYQARVVGTAGNVGANTASQAVTIDTVAPSAPTIASIPENSGGGINAVEASDGTAVVVGLAGSGAAAGDTLTIGWGGQTVSHTLLAGEIAGNSATVTVPTATIEAQGQGTFDVTAGLTDAAGNAGPSSAATPVTVDTSAPTAVVAITAIAPDNGASSSDFVTNATVLTVSGTHGVLGAGEKVQVSSDGGASWADATSTTSTWSYSDPATHGTSFTYQARVVGTAGNVGANTASQAVTIDTAAPSAVVAITAIATDSGTSSSDFVTNDTTLTVSGTHGVLGPDEKVQVSSDGGASWADATASTTSTWSYTDPTTHGTSFTYQARIVDTAGNVGANIASQAVTVDTSSPTAVVAITAIAPDNGTSSSDFVTNATVLTVSGTHGVLGAGEKVQVSSDGGASWADATSTTSTWSYSDPATHGTSFTYQARVVGTAGNVGANTASQAVTIDTSAPSAPTISSIPENSGGGINAIEASDGTAVVVGLAGSGAVAGDTLTIGWGGQTVSHTLLAGEIAGNSATVTVPTATIEAQGQGTFDVTAGLTDAAGNAGPSSAATPVTVDTSAPTAVVAITAIAPDNGASSSDFVTNATTLTVSGTHGVLGAGEKVQVSSDGGASWADATSTASTWSYSDPATHGTSFTYQARVVGTAGNVGANTASQAVTIDTVAPSAPTISSIPENSGGGINAVEASDGTAVVVGLAGSGAVAGDTLTIGWGGQTVSHTLLAGEIAGNSATVTVPTATIEAQGQGTFDVTAGLTDAAGNAGPSSAATPVTVDTSSPTAVVAITAIAPDNGTSSSDFVTNATVLTVSGTHGVLGAGEKVQVSSDGGASWADATSTTSTWSYSDPATHGTSFTYQARVVGTAGNVGANTASQAVTIDTVAPSAPTISSIPENSGGGINAVEASDGTAVVVGLAGSGAAAGDTLTIGWGGQTVSHTLLAGEIAGNSATVTVPLATIEAQGQGTFDVTARLTDAAGNAGPSSAATPVTVDTSSPTAVVAITAIAPDNGTSSSDFVTNATTLTVSGTHGVLGAGEKVQVSSDGGASWADATSTASTWSYSDPATHGTSFTYQARVVGTAGNVGANTASQAVTIDTAAPTAPTNTSVPENGGGGINGVEASAGTGVVGGRAGWGGGAGDTLTIGWGGQTVSHTLLAGEIAGNSATVTVPTATIEAQGQGTFDVTAGLTDAAGNAGPSSAATPVTVDTSSPTAVVAITAITPDNGTSSSDFVTNATVLTVSGTHGVLGAGEKVQVSSDGGATWADATTSTASTWSYTDPATHGTSFTYQARVVDAVGNVGANTASQAVTIDTAAPAAPTISSIPENGGGGINASEASDGTPVVVGLAGSGAAAGDTLAINWGGQTVNHTLLAAEISGNSATVTVPTATIEAQGNGTFNVTATLTDVAGNPGPNSAATSVTVDTSSPTAVVAITAIAPDNGASSSDFVTDATVLTVSGTHGVLGAGEKVQVSSDGGASWADATSTASTWSYSDPATHGTSFTYQARVVGTAGNVGANTASQAVTIDTAAPSAPSISSIPENSGGGINAVEASDGTAVVVGLAGSGAVAGDTLTIGWGSQTVSHTLLAGDISGNSATVTVPLATIEAQGQGTFDVTARLTDAAGNAGPSSAATPVTVDTSSPTAVVAITAIAPDNGTSSSDFVTNDTVLTVSGTHGTLGTGEKVQVSSDGGANWADGHQLRPAPGAYSDPATHGTRASPTRRGSSAPRATSVRTPPARRGDGRHGCAFGAVDQLDPGEQWRRHQRGRGLGRHGGGGGPGGQRGGGGRHADHRLGQPDGQLHAPGGRHRRQQRDGDGAARDDHDARQRHVRRDGWADRRGGQPQPDSAPTPVTVDTSSPTAPSITAIPENSGGGINASEASNGTPVVVGLAGTGAVAGDELTIDWGGQTVDYTLLAADISGSSATVTVPLATITAQGQGTFDVTAMLTDAAGNPSPDSAPTSVTVDTVAPAAPSITAIPENSGGGINASEASNGTPVVVGLTGTGAAAGDKLTIDWGGQTVDYTLLATDIAGNSATVTVPLATITAQGQGTFDVTAMLTDAAGNPSPDSAPTLVTVDTVAPLAPSITAIPENSGGGINASEASDGTPVVVGLAGTGAVAGDELTINWGGQTVDYTLLAADIAGSSATVTVPLATITAQGQGTFDVTAMLTDAAGNPSPDSAPTLVTVDTVAPAAPSITAIPENSAGGINASEASNGTPVEVGLTGTGAAAGDRLTINWGGQTVDYTLVAADISGSSATVTVPLATITTQGQGTFDVTAMLTDAAGNPSPASAPTLVTVDTVAPAAPSITAIPENSAGGINASEASNGTPVEVGLTGTGAAGAGDEVQVTSDWGGQPVDYTLLAADIAGSSATVTVPLATITAQGFTRPVRGSSAPRATSVRTPPARTRRRPWSRSTRRHRRAPTISSIPENSGGGINASEAPRTARRWWWAWRAAGRWRSDTLTIGWGGQTVDYTLLAGEIAGQQRHGDGADSRRSRRRARARST